MKYEFPENYEIGFHDEDGTLDEYLEWGWEIEFVYNDTKYNIDGLEIRNRETNRIVLSEESDDVQRFLSLPFEGKTVREVLSEAYITGLH